MEEQKLTDLKELFIEISNKFIESGEIKKIDDIFDEIATVESDIFDEELHYN